LPDIINLLPDNLANQIAAGEVIQRPASAVKELLENAVDAGAKHIHLIIKDAGKELIKLIDDGKGMSETDARMCFERHATSKIKNINDLFGVTTMGFRGEALASIAAVAQVELKTKQAHATYGTQILITDSKVSSQEPCSTNNGTTFIIKNLFYNVPARRSFLKSNTTELRHIVDEFTRVAMAFPEVAFKLTNADTDVFNLGAGSYKQRIVGLMGNTINNKLVTVNEPNDYLSINGFIGTPQTAAKSRGMQFLFVNNRFIKSAYISHAVTNAFAQLIAKDEYPAYFLNLQIDPTKIDANVHPTKQEIKFEDEKIIYAFVNSAVKHALSTNSISPSLDFTLNKDIASLPSITQPFTHNTKQQVSEQNLYQGFTQANKAHFIEKNQKPGNWQSLYQISAELDTAQQILSNTPSAPIHSLQQVSSIAEQAIVLGKYIAYTSNNGLLLIDVYKAHVNVYYHKLLLQTNASTAATVQVLLHPLTLSLNVHNSLLLTELMPTFNILGFVIEPFGDNTFIIQGIPTDAIEQDIIKIIEALLEDFKHNSTQQSLKKQEQLCLALARQKATASVLNSNTQAQELCTLLFNTSHPNITPTGDAVFVNISFAEIEKRLTQKV
jgi:DNA mismatch repair protein MutL